MKWWFFDMSIEIPSRESQKRFVPHHILKLIDSGHENENSRIKKRNLCLFTYIPEVSTQIKASTWLLTIIKQCSNEHNKSEFCYKFSLGQMPFTAITQPKCKTKIGKMNKKCAGLVYLLPVTWSTRNVQINNLLTMAADLGKK